MRLRCITCGESPFPLYWCQQCGANTCHECGIVSDTLTECLPCMTAALGDVATTMGIDLLLQEPKPAERDTDGYGRTFTVGFTGWP